MERRQLLAAGAAALGISAVGYALFSPVSDEELIAQVLVELGLALSFSEPIQNPLFFGSGLSERFEKIFTDQVDIRVSEVSAKIPRNRGKLGLAAAHALSRYGSLHVMFSIDDLRVQADSAQCEATATVAGNSGGELRRDTRPVGFEFSKDDGDWLISRAVVRAPR